MPGVFVCRPDADSVAAAMLRSRQEWRGPIEDPPILEFTNERFAQTFLTAIHAALSSPTARRAG
jgi:hypothetical protein